MPFAPKLPEGLPPLRIDTSDARYKALEALATREGWSQKAFSETLGIEATRVLASAPKPAPAAPAAPAPAAKPELPANYAAMSAREQIAFALQQSAAPRRGS
jgi:hypothetical protein